MLLRLFLALATVQCVFGDAKKSKHLVDITEESWRDVLKGEWMVEFHAPWCPACKDLSKTWNSFADWSKDLDIKVAAVDVTANPGLSGRFLVTALPTIYHVKDSVFRSYGGPRDKEDFISFVEQKKWTVIDPVAGWKHPDTPQMAVVAMFFRLSMTVRDAHNYLVEKKGLPPVASYLIFGGATLILGCILGFLIVCVIDCVFPAAGPPKDKQKGKKEDDKKKQKEKEKDKNKKEQKKEQLNKAKDSQSEAEASQNSQSEAEESADESTTRQRKKDEKETAKPGATTANGKPGTAEAKKKK